MPSNVRVTVNQNPATRTVLDIENALKGKTIGSVAFTNTTITFTTKDRTEIVLSWTPANGPVLDAVHYLFPVADIDASSVTAIVQPGR